jgi:hypothetical protein
VLQNISQPRITGSILDDKRSHFPEARERGEEGREGE